MVNRKKKTEKILNDQPKIDINYVAKLASIDLTDQEKKTFEKQLTQILDYVAQIEFIDTKNTEPTFNVSTNKNITRPDEIGTSLTQEEALSNATSTKNGQFVTKGVFDKD